MVMNYDEVKIVVLFGVRYCRIDVRVFKVKEMIEERGFVVGNVVFVFIEVGFGGRGVERDCNLRFVII